MFLSNGVGQTWIFQIGFKLINCLHDNLLLCVFSLNPLHFFFHFWMEDVEL